MWMLGSARRERPLDGLGRRDGLKERVSHLLQSRVVCAPDGAPSEDEAACALLRGAVDYSTGSADTTVAPYDSDHVSLPPDSKQSPFVGDLLETSGREFLERWQETMVRSPSERAELDARLGQVCPFWDRMLKYNKKEYRRFVKELDTRGLIEWVTSPLEFAAFFFVWKKNMKDRRLIVDARLANRAFRDPPGVRLLSSEGLGRME